VVEHDPISRADLRRSEVTADSLAIDRRRKHVELGSLRIHDDDETTEHVLPDEPALRPTLDDLGFEYRKHPVFQLERARFEPMHDGVAIVVRPSCVALR
jgi:hypothetical protein